jgi:hypothetical protein
MRNSYRNLAGQLPNQEVSEETIKKGAEDAREVGRLLKLMAAAVVELIAKDVLMKGLVEEITEGGRRNEKTD